MIKYFWLGLTRKMPGSFSKSRNHSFKFRLPQLSSFFKAVGILAVKSFYCKSSWGSLLGPLIENQCFKVLFYLQCLHVGEPVQCSAWAGQCALYILIMMFEKVMIMLVLLIPQWKKVSQVSNINRCWVVVYVLNFLTSEENVLSSCIVKELIY